MSIFSRRAVAGLIVCAVGVVLHADDIDGPSRFQQNLLVMRNGRVLSGKINHTPQGYFVELPNGSLVVPDKDVLLEAVDLKDAYRKQRELMRRPTTDMRKGLALWCIANSLYKEARAEIKDALRMEPDREDLRRLYVRLEQTLNPQLIPSDAASPAAQRDIAGYRLPPAQSLAGLTRETAREFTRRVQPLLTNNCGNAGCHGGTAGGAFQIRYVRPGNGQFRHITEQNLAAVAGLIDSKNASASPLLRVPQAPHGNARVSAFGGRGGARQFEILRNWVTDVVSEGGIQLGTSAKFDSLVQAAGEQTPTQSAQSVIVQTSGVQPPVVASREAAFATPVLEQSPTEPRAVPEPAENADDDAFFEELLNEKSRDPFDPEVFNQQRPTRP